MQSVVLGGAVVLAHFARGGLGLGVDYPIKVGACAAVVMGLTAARVHAHPFARFGAANVVTTVRGGLVALVVSLVGEPTAPIIAGAVVAVSIAVTLLDSVDGWLARRDGVASPFGARFDMETDAALILALAMLAWLYGKAGPWVLLSGLLRYLFIAAGWIWPWMRRPLRPSVRGKTICVAQIVALILAITPGIGPPASASIAGVGLLALCYSFFVDTAWLWRHAGSPMAPIAGTG
jgi:phosphatidylglycerophosphate synthase